MSAEDTLLVLLDMSSPNPAVEESKKDTKQLPAALKNDSSPQHQCGKAASFKTDVRCELDMSCHDFEHDVDNILPFGINKMVFQSGLSGEPGRFLRRNVAARQPMSVTINFDNYLNGIYLILKEALTYLLTIKGLLKETDIAKQVENTAVELMKGVQYLPFLRSGFRTFLEVCNISKGRSFQSHLWYHLLLPPPSNSLAM